MNSIQKIVEVLSAVKVLKDLPVMQLKENKQVLEEINGVLNSSFVGSIFADIKREHQGDLAAKNQSDNVSKIHPESLEFLSSYARYRGAFNDRVSKGQPVAYTKTLTRTLAFNQAKKANTLLSKADYNFKEAKEFKEVYNSIFSNKSLQIGTAQDPTIMGSYIDYSPYIYNYQYYLSIPTLSQTIDKGIQMATRELPEIDVDDEKLKDELYKYFHRTQFNDKVRKMLLNSHLSPRGSVIVPIIENDTVRFNVFNDTQFTYSVSPNYNKLSFRDGGYGVASVFVLGYNLQNGVTCHFLCPGFEPIFGVGKNRLFQLKDAAEAINIYLYTIKVLCIRAQVLVQKWGGEGQNDTLLQKAKALTAHINSSLSLSTSVDMPETASLEILNNNINEGFSKISPIIKEYQGMLSGIMPDFFYGSDTAYSANSFNIQATHQNIRSDIQEPQIEPIYRFAINSILNNDKRFSKWKKYEDQFEVKFKSLYEPTEVEKATIEKTRIENIIQMSDYPDLVDVFKGEGLLPENYKMPSRGDIDTPT